jgi:hypothetical protein
LKQPEKEEDIEGVEQQTHEMMAARVQSKKLIIEHVGPPGKGMPESCLQRGQGPSKVCPGKTLLDLRIVGNVEVIIQGHELMARDREIDDEGSHDQEHSGYPFRVLTKEGQNIHSLEEIRLRFS